MKKFILSAALALACFSAQAGNEVIKNDDDKNSKAKAKVVKANAKPEFGYCKVKVKQEMVCGGETITIETSGWSYLGCSVAFAAAMWYQECP